MAAHVLAALKRYGSKVVLLKSHSYKHKFTRKASRNFSPKTHSFNFFKIFTKNIGLWCVRVIHYSYKNQLCVKLMRLRQHAIVVA